MSSRRRNGKYSKRRLDWAKFTDFRSRNSRDDLAKLCAGFDRDRLKEIFESRDETGLCPIHWAAINNRSDLIEFMVDNGSPLRKRCNNKVFADGSPLHLAAMNGSIEAAAMLLSKSLELDRNRTGPKNLMAGKEETVVSEEPAGRRFTSQLLEERDADGQTPLMRSAAPRSKRLDTIQDLLRKNLWSLGGRPAEMALFLICNGADWRLRESVNGMNLMHLAIANDYDDIVNLLLVIDKQLLHVPVDLKQLSGSSSIMKPGEKNGTRAADRTPSGQSSDTDDSPTPSDLSADQSFTGSERPLISKRTKVERTVERLASRGLQPLQLAILYGRIGIISLLWHAGRARTDEPLDSLSTAIDIQRQAVKDHSTSGKDLKQILWRACWTNKDELARFVRPTLLKMLVVLDLGAMALFWAPLYAQSTDEGRLVLPGLRSGVFFVSFSVTLALAFRVMLKNPGHLRKNSMQYLSELTRLLRESSKSKSKPDGSQKEGTLRNSLIVVPENNEQGPLIKLDDGQIKNQQQQQQQRQQQQSSGLAVQLPEAPNWQTQFELKDKVRLLCHKCRCMRRPRSRHCNHCNHCVQDFDHHCIYLSCCIGRFNRFDFLLSMIFLSVTSAYGTLVQATSPHRFERSNFWYAIGFVWVGKYIILAGFNSFMILRRACLGVTLYENIRSKRIRNIFGPEGPPEAISKSHKVYSTIKGSFWRYSPNRYLTGELPSDKIMSNLREFANFISLDEYLLTLFCADTVLTRSLLSNDSRVNMYKFT